MIEKTVRNYLHNKNTINPKDFEHIEGAIRMHAYIKEHPKNKTPNI